MSYGHASRVDRFIRLDGEYLIGRLVTAITATGIASHRSQQIEAWEQEIEILKQQLADPHFKEWFLVMEYEIPRRDRRPDVILLSARTIFVVEFKIGAKAYDSSSCFQVSRYARDLRDFHSESHDRRIVPILCATHADHGTVHRVQFPGSTTGVSSLIKTNSHDLGRWLMECDRQFGSSGTLAQLDGESWLNSAYRPTPTIIEAAVQLYEGHGVREISHRHAHNLDQTTRMLVQLIEDARCSGNRVVCFVTGIPGAGKTLTGLDVVHDQSQGAKPASGIFLSGNGPLIRIVREALVMSQMTRGGTRHECEHAVSTFIQNVHQFIRSHREDVGRVPHENVVVFDEAQRAWDRAQMRRKQGIESSEASLLFEIMERLPDWAVIIALVGGGQEIFSGEAGIEEWGRAIVSRPVPWKVVAAREAVVGGNSVAGHRLFENGVPADLLYEEAPLAHLEVAVRSHRAQQWAEWVNELLSLNLDAAQSLFPESLEFPCFVTRDLEEVRAYLRELQSSFPEDRAGLVATSKDHRLRAEGIERAGAFLRGYAFDKWFLAPHTDARSSYSLEVAASEFECQGLELDWAGVCWGGDLTPSEDYLEWEFRKFRGAVWQVVRKQEERAYTKNRYRVLLTRARSGLVIWVPRGDSADPTRDPERFDRVFKALRRAGVPVLEQQRKESRN